MTGVIVIAIEQIAKDFHCFNIAQADIIQTPHRLHLKGDFPIIIFYIYNIILYSAKSIQFKALHN